MTIHNNNTVHEHNLGRESLGIGNDSCSQISNNAIPSSTPLSNAKGHTHSLVITNLIKDLTDFATKVLKETSDNKKLIMEQNRWVKKTIVAIVSETSVMDSDAAKDIINRIVDVVKTMPKSISKGVMNAKQAKAVFEACKNSDINKAIDIIEIVPASDRGNFFQQIISETSKMDKATTIQVMSRLINLINVVGRTQDAKIKDLKAICSQFIIATQPKHSPEDHLICAETRIELLKILPRDFSPINYLSDLISQVPNREILEFDIMKICTDIVKERYTKAEEILMDVSTQLVSKNIENIDRAISVMEAIPKLESKRSPYFIIGMVNTLMVLGKASELEKVINVIKRIPNPDVRRDVSRDVTNILKLKGKQSFPVEILKLIEEVEHQNKLEELIKEERNEDPHYEKYKKELCEELGKEIEENREYPKPINNIPASKTPPAPGYVRRIICQLNANVNANNLMKDLIDSATLLKKADKGSEKPQQQQIKEIIKKILFETSMMDNESAKNVINSIGNILITIPKSIDYVTTNVKDEKLTEGIFKAYINNNINKAIDFIEMILPKLSLSMGVNFFRQIIRETSKMDKTATMTMQVMNRLIHIVEKIAEKKQITVDIKDHYLSTICWQFIVTNTNSEHPTESRLKDCTETLIKFLKILPKQNLQYSESIYLKNLILQASVPEIEGNIIKMVMDIVKERHGLEAGEVIFEKVSKSLCSGIYRDIDRAISVMEEIPKLESKRSLDAVEAIIAELFAENEPPSFRIAKVINIIEKISDSAQKNQFLGMITDKLSVKDKPLETELIYRGLKLNEERRRKAIIISYYETFNKRSSDVK